MTGRLSALGRLLPDAVSGDGVAGPDGPGDSEPVATGAGDDRFLAVRDLKKHYDEGLFGAPVKAVDGVSFDLQEGETLALVGESGCGKTTLGRTVVGLEPATAGTVRAGDRVVTDLSGAEKRRWQRAAQMVFQDPAASLNDRLTVGEIVREPLDAHDEGTPASRRERVFDLLDMVGLQEAHYTRYPHQFSGGQRQRVAIARALALEPEFLVLDEPVSALDVSVQARIINLLADLQDELGLTYLFIAHDLSVVRHISDRVAVMYLGSIVERGPTESVFADPAHPYTRSLLSAVPGSDGAGADGGGRITLRGTPPNPRHPPDGCRFATRCPAKVRPESLDGLDPAAHDRVEELRTVLRERSRGSTVSARLPGPLGRTGVELPDYEALFPADVDVPEEAESAVRAALSAAEDGRADDALAELAGTFDSVCDRERPTDHEVGDGHTSRCVRHRRDQRSVDDALRSD